MNYFIQTNELENQIKDVKRKLNLLMNGVVSDTMKHYGLCYKQIYGVQIPMLKQLSRSFAPNHDLAQRLWVLQIRETMILATLVQPIETFSEKHAEQWMDSVNNIELAEQTCMNLFAQLPYAKSWSLTLISSNNEWRQITGYILMTRIKEIIEMSDVEQIVTHSSKLLTTDNYHLYKSIATCLAKLCRNGNETATLIQSKTNELLNTTSNAHRYVKNEIENELSFIHK